MFSIQLLLTLVIASGAHAGFTPSPKGMANSTVPPANAVPAFPTNTSLAGSPSSLPNITLPTNPNNPAWPTNLSLPGLIPGDISSGRCLCPAPPICPTLPSPVVPGANIPSFSAAAVVIPPSTNASGLVSPTGFTAPTNDTVTAPHNTDNSTSSAATNSLSFFTLLTAGALAAAV